MRKASSSAAVVSDLLSFRPYSPKPGTAEDKGHTYLIGVENEAASHVLEGMMPLLGRLLGEKVIEVRARKMEQMVNFMTEQMLMPTAIDMQMAQRLATRHARILNEFGYFTGEQLADANRSQAASRSALVDNWRKRRQVFAVRHPDATTARSREVYPAFQFDNHKPIKAVQAILEAFGDRKDPWKLALWFTSNNGWLADQARPVDLLTSESDAVIQAARQDAGGSAA